MASRAEPNNTHTHAHAPLTAPVLFIRAIPDMSYRPSTLPVRVIPMLPVDAMFVTYVLLAPYVGDVASRSYVRSAVAVSTRRITDRQTCKKKTQT